MKLSDTLENIKQSLPLALSGGLDHEFDSKMVEEIIKVGFLLNNLTLNDHHELVFQYNGFKLSVVISHEETDEDFYICIMIKDEVFLNALITFKRDNRLNQIVK